MQLLKVLLSTTAPSLLCYLFNLCLRKGCTPKRWSNTTIHLTTKDPTKARDVSNVRPITLVCMFRKIFERLLLVQSSAEGWASLHPAQAGFRANCSTYTNAAIVHHALATESCKLAVFLDFQAAFDMIDHLRLARILQDCACPANTIRCIASLNFDGQDHRCALTVTSLRGLVGPGEFRKDLRLRRLCGTYTSTTWSQV